MAGWTDAHNHLQDPRLGDAAPLIDAMRSAGVTRCIVNATRESDWAAVESLAISHPGFVLPAFGIHPWHAHTATDGWESRLRSLLAKHPLASVGECGLDQWIENPGLETQMEVFLSQLRIARETRRAATIHCLKAWAPLLDAFRRETPPARFLMHSYGGSIEIALRLIPMGAFFSFSGYFLHPRKRAVVETFRKLPRERILLETDAPDMLPPPSAIAFPLPQNLNHPANLTKIGGALATALGMTAAELAETTSENARRFAGF